MTVSEASSHSKEAQFQAEVDKAVHKDYEATKSRFLVTDPDLLISMMLDTVDYNQKEKAKLEKAYKRTQEAYGDSTRKFSNTLALLHAVRVAFPAPSEGVVPIETTIGRLFHDLTEKPFHFRPEDFEEYGAGVVEITRALACGPIEDYFSHYLPKITADDAAYPELLIVPSKAGRDIVDNVLDPFALHRSIERQPETQAEMHTHHNKYDEAIPLLFPKSRGARRRELVIAEASARHALAKGKEANRAPNLILLG